jgi:integrase
VRTKFSKSFTTIFLTKEKLWGLDDPLFLATHVIVGSERRFEASGLERKHWSNATPIRAIFKEAFTRAGLPYFNPHSFRKTLARLGEKLCRTPEQFKAWSQNLGHEKVLTTFSSYREVAAERQREIIRELALPMDSDPQVEEILKQLVRVAKRTAA